MMGVEGLDAGVPGMGAKGASEVANVAMADTINKRNVAQDDAGDYVTLGDGGFVPPTLWNPPF